MSLIKQTKNTSISNETDDEIMNVVNSEEYLNNSTADEAEFYSKHTEIRKVSKGTVLLKEGQIAKNCYYVCKGCIREYFVKDGIEVTTEFYTEWDSLSDDNSKKNKTPSHLNWECLVDSIVSVVPYEVELEMYKRFPRLEALCRIETEKKFGEHKLAVHHFHSSTPEERYNNLLNTRPEILELAPLYHIASYLGVKPESLSRIRNRIRNANR